MLTITAAAFDPLRILNALIHLPIRLPAAGVSRGIPGVKLERGIKNLYGILDVLLLVVILQIAKPLQVEIICAGHLCAVRPQSLTFSWLNFQLQHPHSCIDNLVLKGKGIGSRHGQTLSPELPVRPSIHQGNVDPYSISGSLQIAFDYKRGAELLANIVYCTGTSGTNLGSGHDLQCGIDG